VLATVLFVFAVVATPKEQIWAFGVHATLVVAVAVIGRVSLTFLARRLVIELPFVAFAFLLPLLGRGPQVEVLGIELSRPGLWAAWNILAKATLGVAASVVLASTTAVPALLAGLERLHVPRTLVAITSFMIRYGDVLVADLQRMRVARLARGHDPRWIWQARAIAQSAGVLFVRSYERGERVFLAMQSRGYEGAMPLDDAPSAQHWWFECLALPCVAAGVSIVAWTLQ
jgi:cobalt/nickel transport system permease protein